MAAAAAAVGGLLLNDDAGLGVTLEELFGAEEALAGLALIGMRTDLMRMSLRRVIVAEDEMLLPEALQLVQRVATNRNRLLPAFSARFAENGGYFAVVVNEIPVIEGESFPRRILLLGDDLLDVRVRSAARESHRRSRSRLDVFKAVERDFARQIKIPKLLFSEEL